MKRRQFLSAAVTLGAAVAAVPSTSALMSESDVKGIATENSKLKPPASGTIPVAMVISQGVNVIDLSGPWGVFESVQVPGAGFELFTVSDQKELVSSGSGLQLMPSYTYEDMP